MKKLLYIIPMALMFSCMGMFTVVADLGMTEEEFRKKNMVYEVVEMWGDVKIYRVQHSPREIPKYVYFENGKLIRMDEGQKRYAGMHYPGPFGETFPEEPEF